MTRAALAAVFLTATLATVASGCGDSTTYSQEQVKSAFNRHGLRLTPLFVNGKKANKVLIPAENSGVTYFVVEVLASDQEARGSFHGFQNFGLALRNRNVIVSTKARLDPGLRKRITLSVRSLH
jgi:DMSO/TMAO reductase YedYZ molybdopterin-dependent catalytic subunit